MYGRDGRLYENLAFICMDEMEGCMKISPAGVSIRNSGDSRL
jgi:hypothetical protein